MRKFFLPLASAPRPALWLGFGGLLPFVGLTILTVVWPDTWYAFWLTTLLQYGAVILTFVGALQWGYAVGLARSGDNATARFLWSVMPALVAWLSFQFPVWTALQLEAAALTLCYCVDRNFAAADDKPSWLLPLRLILTAVASACLLIASVA